MSSKALMSRVRALLSERNISQAAFARSIGVSPQTLSGWMSGRNRLGVEELEKICSSLRVSPSWLLTGVEDDPAHQSLVLDDYVSIPMFDVQASCGNGYYLNRSALVRMIQVSKDFISKYCSGANERALNIIGITGDSMIPTLDDGDFIIVDTSVTSFYTDAMFAFIIENDLFVKRIQKQAPRIMVISDNQKYAPYQLLPEDMENGFKVIGRVVTTCTVRKA